MPPYRTIPSNEEPEYLRGIEGMIQSIQAARDPAFLTKNAITNPRSLTG